MLNGTQYIAGQKHSVTAYVDPSTFQKIEEMRGDVTRSTFVGKLLTKLINQ